MNFKIPNEISKFEFHVKKAKEHKGTVSLVLKRSKRSLRQNNYIHVLFALYAIEIGLTLEESKTDLKRYCSFMNYEKHGKKYLKQTSKMDTKSLAEFTTWIRNYAGMNGIYLPNSEDYFRNWEAIEKEIEQHKQYL